MKEAFLREKINMDMIRTSVEEDYKRVNNDTWICNQLEDLLIKYEKFQHQHPEKHLTNFELGEHNAINIVIRDLKELLYNADYELEEHNLISGKDEPMSEEKFIITLQNTYEEALVQDFDSIVLTIDTDLGKTYYIYDTPDGFQCDLWGYYFESLTNLASQLYDEMHGNVTDIRIE